MGETLLMYNQEQMALQWKKTCKALTEFNT